MKDLKHEVHHESIHVLDQLYPYHTPLSSLSKYEVHPECNKVSVRYLLSSLILSSLSPTYSRLPNIPNEISIQLIFLQKRVFSSLPPPTYIKLHSIYI